MNQKIYFVAFLFFTLSFVKAQHIIKPNGDAAAKPNLPKVRKINTAIFANVQNLRGLGKTTNEIARILRDNKTKAPEVFNTLKPTTPDAENVAALCSAGFGIHEIVEALKLDGKTASETTGLLKNSTGCTFASNTILNEVRAHYRISLTDLVPIIKTHFTVVNSEIVDFLIPLSASDEYIVDAIGINGMANNRRELTVLLNGKLRNFNKEHLNNVFVVLRRARFAADVNPDVADALLYLEATPTRVLDVFFTNYYSRPTPTSAVELAKIGKYLHLSRAEVSTFLEGKSYTATQVLDALQTVYGI